MTAIRTQHLCKKYGHNTAVADLCLEIETGEIFTLLGANGAGKSTTVNLLTSLQKPTSGSASVFGKDILANYKDVRLMISLMPQGHALDPFLSVYNNLRFFAMLEGLDRTYWKGKVDEILTELDLFEKEDASVMALSGGQFRRLQLARCFLSNRPLAFFDEPTLGIDVVGKFKIWDLIKKHARENNWTVILCTNDMAEAECLSDRIAFLRDGEVVRIGTPDQLKSQVAGRQVKVSFKEPPLTAITSINGHPVIHENSDIFIFVDDNQSDLRPLLNKISEFGPISNLNIEKPSLVDVFKAMKGGRNDRNNLERN